MSRGARQGKRRERERIGGERMSGERPSAFRRLSLPYRATTWFPLAARDATSTCLKHRLSNRTVGSFSDDVRKVSAGGRQWREQIKGRVLVLRSATVGVFFREADKAKFRS